MATARRTLVCFSSASRRPRSANTFPELATTPSRLFPFAISRLVILAGRLEPSRNQFHVRLGRLYSFRGFLLKSVKNIESLVKLHGVHRTIGVASVVLYYFKNSRTFSFPRLRL